jgi:hypothetical protein
LARRGAVRGLFVTALADDDADLALGWVVEKFRRLEHGGLLDLALDASRQDEHAARYAAQQQRDSRERGPGEQARHSRHNFHGQICRATRDQFLAPGTEEERIAGFQPHDSLATKRTLDQAVADVLGAQGRKSADFTSDHESLAGFRQDVFERFGEEIVQDDDLRLLQKFAPSARNQPWVTRACANDSDASCAILCHAFDPRCRRLPAPSWHVAGQCQRGRDFAPSTHPMKSCTRNRFPVDRLPPGP